MIKSDKRYFVLDHGVEVLSISFEVVTVKGSIDIKGSFCK